MSSGFHEVVDQHMNWLSGQVISCAIEVHKTLGPGFLEAVYEEALCIELRHREIAFIRQHPVQVLYKGEVVGQGRIDPFVEERLIVELKAVETLLEVHKAQVLSYLKSTGMPPGLLINFNVDLLKNGVRRIIWTDATK